MEMQSHREVYYQDSDFKIEFNRELDCITVHCEVNKLSPSSVRRGLRIFEQMKSEFADKILVTITPNPKFVKMAGGVSIGELEVDNKKYEVMTWVSK